MQEKEAVLAVIDGEPITEEDLKYALTISHRREDLSSAGALNLSHYVQKLVDDRLIIHEARNAGMDQYPEVKQAIQAYILRESVVRLHDEEIVRKVTVTEEEVKDYYRQNYKRGDVPDEEFNNVKGRIEKEFRKQKEKERSDEYLKHLREKVNTKIDKELLSAINLEGGRDEIENWSKDKRPLAEVNGAVLTVQDFITLITPSFKGSGESIINAWIDRKAIDIEALSRHYERNPDLTKMVYHYENQLLKNAFIKKIIIPQIVVTDKDLEEYHSTHQKNFVKPVHYKIQQITAKTEEGAHEILDSLQKGADFSWLAKRKSADSASFNGGEAGWFTKEELPKPVREIIDTLQVGDVSPVIKNNSSYGIIKLQEKTGEEIEELRKVKNAVYKAYMSEQVNNLMDKYVNQLKTDAQIKINEREIRAVEEKVKQKS
jgi:parvulin-like peptidyl-prolyl isomerase